jgi:hypothetical protein
MDIRIDSFFVRLYRYFYNMDCYESMPNGLCTYFWKLVFACVLIVPLEIIGLPNTLLRLILRSDYHPPFAKAGMTCVFIFCSMVLYLCLLPVVNIWYPQSPDDIFGAYILDSVILIILLIIYLISSNKSNLIGQYIRARSKGICPRINWVKPKPKPTPKSLDELKAIALEVGTEVVRQHNLTNS